MARPYTVIFSTMTVDGRIADPTGYSRLSCDEDFRLQHMLRAWSDAVMVGSRTALVDDPRLTVRLSPGRSPLRVVVDSRLAVPPTARMLSVPGKGVLVTVEDHPVERLEPYTRRGVRVVAAGRGRVDLARALEELHESLGVRRLLVEGGGGLNCALLRQGLVDEVRVTVAPQVFGAGVSIFNGDGCKSSLALWEIRTMCGGWVHLRYRTVF
ncbi:MAG: 2,5-diamino-6-(ribosylamino)-4(3H)-pyrimidinone 5'-phosphate reductase [Desulfurococcales archaeon]|nr:2,5-diamino-6-(ribosylamino)-4(3H)-pyrimidinone 5'-phosphate reductase [Desulfurococcales archaeon]